MGTLVNNVSDIGGPLFISEERANVVQFSASLDYSKLAIVSGLVPANKNPYLIFGIFTNQVWLSIFVSIFIVAGTACLIYSILPSGHSKKKSEAFLRFMWIFQASLLGQEFGANGRHFLQHIWTSRSFKFLQGVWIISCIVLTYTYQGKIISSYAADKMKPKYETLDDVRADKRVEFGTLANSYPFICLQKLASTDPDIWIRVQRNLADIVTDVPYWLDTVEELEAVFLVDIVYAKYMVGERFKKTGKCGIRVTAVEICASNIAFPTRKGLNQHILGKFNYGILRYNEAALIQRHLTENLLFYDICTQTTISSTKALNMWDLLGAFTVLASGLIISILYFAVEMVTARIRKMKKICKIKMIVVEPALNH